MVLTGTVEEIEPKDFRDNERGIAGAVYAIIGEPVGRKALRVELAEAGFIAKERAAGHCHTTRDERFDRGVEPNDWNVLRVEKFRRALLRVSSTAQSEHYRFFGFRGTAKNEAQLLCFKRTEGGLTKALEKLRDEKAGRFFNTIVEVNKAPCQLTSEERADGGLAGAHESGEANNGRAPGASAKSGILRHDCGANKSIALQDTNCTTEGRELDFSEAGADAAEKTVRVLSSGSANTVCVGLEERLGAIVHGTEICLRVKIERIRAGKTNFNYAFAASHRVKAGAEE